MRTIGQLWRDATSAGRSTPAYLVERGERWEEVSWEEAGARVASVPRRNLSGFVRVASDPALRWHASR